MLTLLHGSDLHFGKHFDPVAGQAFREAVRSLEPDLVILSGDFTQRAKVREYRAARAYLDDLSEVPLVVTPGNHDVPLYRFWERAFSPLRNYRRFITRELDYSSRVAGATVVSLNSTAPHSAIVNGRLHKAQLRFASQAFQGAPEADLRVLVTHHNLVPAPDDPRQKILPGHRRLLTELAAMGVELVLGGHLHRGFWADTSQGSPGIPSGGDGVQTTALVYCGTTTSLRGRTREVGANSFNVLKVETHGIEVTRYRRDRGGGDFEPVTTAEFPRKGGMIP
jgi:3',5'-cyclic AMP phosphodiesterase CpdA